MNCTMLEKVSVIGFKRKMPFDCCSLATRKVECFSTVSLLQLWTVELLLV